MQKNVWQKAWGHDTYRTALSKVRRTGVEITVVFPEDVLPTITCGWGGGATRKKVAIADRVAVPPVSAPVLRHPTILEGARAQGFPDEWTWPKGETDAWTLIGNAVSSPVSKAIGDHLVSLHGGEKPKAKVVLPAKRVAGYARAYRGEEDSVPSIEFDE
jgi:site-specific DNA-cytosine methylase